MARSYNLISKYPSYQPSIRHYSYKAPLSYS
uniref:Uncharacterized protein n=1 Tax=Rhizophora mucronata TaxID=61149 RepID=A0A2P2J1G2_RHIMU